MAGFRSFTISMARLCSSFLRPILFFPAKPRSICSSETRKVITILCKVKLPNSPKFPISILGRDTTRSLSPHVSACLKWCMTPQISKAESEQGRVTYPQLLLLTLIGHLDCRSPCIMSRKSPILSSLYNYTTPDLRSNVKSWALESGAPLTQVSMCYQFRPDGYNLSNSQ